jgi:hypothetical protein
MTQLGITKRSNFFQIYYTAICVAYCKTKRRTTKQVSVQVTEKLEEAPQPLRLARKKNKNQKRRRRLTGRECQRRRRASEFVQFIFLLGPPKNSLFSLHILF